MAGICFGGGGEGGGERESQETMSLCFKLHDVLRFNDNYMFCSFSVSIQVLDIKNRL